MFEVCRKAILEEHAMAMPKRILGKSGLEVSQLGFGCMRPPPSP